MENSPLPSDHAFKRMKKIEVIEFVKKMDKGLNNLEGELSVALAERDQADEANQKLNEFTRDPNWDKITKFFKLELGFNNEAKFNYQNVIDVIKDLEQESLHKNEWNEEQQGEIEMLREKINQMKQLLSHV